MVLLFSTQAQVGEYTMKVTTRINGSTSGAKNPNNCGNFYKLRLAFADQLQEWSQDNPAIPLHWDEYMPIADSQSLNSYLNSPLNEFVHEMSFPANKIPKSIFIYGEKNTDANFCNSTGAYSVINIGANYTNGCYELKDNSNKIPKWPPLWGYNIKIEIYPKEFKIAASKTAMGYVIPTTGSEEFPKAILTAPKGFDPQFYQWEYSTTNTNFDFFWKPFPDKFQGLDSIEICAQDLLGNSAEGYFDEKLYIRIQYANCGFLNKKYSNVFELTTIDDTEAKGEYVMKTTVDIFDAQNNNTDKCLNFYNLTLYVKDPLKPNDGNKPFPNNGLPFVWQDLNPINANPKQYRHKIFFPNTLIPNHLWIQGRRSFNPNTCNNFENYGSIGFSSDYNDCYDKTHNGKIPNWGSNVNIHIYPKKIDIESEKDNIDKILPVDEKIPITATKGFLKESYIWHYKLNVDGPEGQWTYFKPAFQTGDSVSVSAKDLLGEENIEEKLGKNVTVRVSYGCYGINKYSNYLTFNTRLSSPHITAVNTFPNKCFGEANGHVKIQFDRPLKPNETLNIIIDDTIHNVQYLKDNIVLAQDNSFTWPQELDPGGFKIELIGKYNEIATYAKGPKHFAITGFESPLPVAFTALKKNDVYCFNGKDGKIDITATGGAGNYKLGYKKQGQTDYTWVNFSEADKHTLSNLDSGIYLIRVKDANNCIELNQGLEVIRNVIISQPELPLKIDFSEITDPLQFGSTDGKVKIILNGGTPKPGDTYDVQWKNLNNVVLNGHVNNVVPSGYQTILQSIGKGRYIINATDANYALAAADSKSGCMVKDTFQLTEPPLLIVNVEEQHYISCKGDQDGKLVAHASGGVKFPGDMPYQYQWFKKINNQDVIINQTDSIATGLAAGKYFVKITDFNNIIKSSSVFNLTEPGLLQVQLTSTPVLCNGDNTGTATSEVTGGTPGYTYEWTTNATTPAINNLKEGNYWVYVKDAHQCETQGQINVVAPGGIEIDTLIKQPSCYQSCDGEIKLIVSGGKAPYTYYWNNGAVAKDIVNLCAGTYTVAVKDANNCSVNKSFTLANPFPFTINLGGNKTLCNGQSFEADATINEPNAQYQWASNNGFISNLPKVNLTNEGVYWVKVTNSKGCIAKDTLTIQRSTADIAAEFIVSTQAFRGELVRFINISSPMPDNISWIVPNDPNIEILSNTQNIAELKFKDTGIYYISLKSFKDGCEKIFTKKVIVVEPQEFDNIGQVIDPFIKNFTMAPNPSTGQFTVKVVLKEQSKIRLRMFNILTNVQVSDRYESGSDQYILPYNVNLSSGTYFLLLETPKGNSMHKIIIN